VSAGGQLQRRPDGPASPTPGASRRDVALIDLLDRLLEGGVAIHGQIMLSVADIDLVELDLRVLVAAVDTVAGR